MSMIPVSTTTIRIVDRTSASSVIEPTIINAYSAMTIPPYRRAIDFLSGTLANFGRSVRRAGVKLDPAAPPHRLEPLLNGPPNRYQNALVLWRTWYGNAAHRGNGYVRIQRDPKTLEAIALHNLTPDDVLPFRIIPEGQEFPEQWYFIRSLKISLRSADVMHLQGISYDGQQGADPVALHEGTLQHAATLTRFQAKYLQSGTNIRAAVEFPGEVQPPVLSQVRDSLRKNYFGPDAPEDVLLLTDGAKLNNTTVTPRDSQIAEQSGNITKQIAQMTNVPPEFLFELSEAKYNAAIEQAGESVVRYTLMPWIKQAEYELTAKLLTPADRTAGYSVHLNVDGLLRGNTAAVNKSATETVGAGIRTANEGRALIGEPPLDDPEANKLKARGDTAPKASPGGSAENLPQS